MKEKLKNVLLALFGVGILLFLSITAIADLTNKDDLHTVTLCAAYDVLEVEHSINGLIPIGTDYYYLGFDDAYNAYLIKGSKKWLDKNFDSEYVAKESGGLQVKGLAKNISDYKTQDELKKRLSQLEGVQYPLGMSTCMNLNYKTTAILKLAECLLLIVMFLFGWHILKQKDSVAPALIKVWLVSIFAALFLLIILL